MSIEWFKIEQNPDRDFKILGKLLIDFRDRVVNQEKEIASLQEENDKLLRIKNDNEARINEFQDKFVFEFELRIKNQEKEIASLKNEIDKLSTAKNYDDATIKDLQGEIENLEKISKEKDSTIGENTNMIETLNVSLDTTISEREKQINDLMEEKNTLKTELEEKIKDLENDKSSLQDSEASLKQQLEEMESDYKNKISDLEIVYKYQIADLESRRESLEQDKLAIQKEKDALADKLKFMDDQMQARDFAYFKKLVKERSERAAEANRPKE